MVRLLLFLPGLLLAAPLLLRPTGTLWARGFNGQGQLGDGSTTSRRFSGGRATAGASGPTRLPRPAGLRPGVYILRSGAPAQRPTVE